MSTFVTMNVNEIETTRILVKCSYRYMIFDEDGDFIDDVDFKDVKD